MLSGPHSFGRDTRASIVRLVFFALALIPAFASQSQAADGDIVLYPSDVTTISGMWSRVPSTTGAGGMKMTTPDTGFAATAEPIAAPTHYFETSFQAPAGVAYHVWLRLRGFGDSKWNESVWVQFGDGVAADGSPLWRIGTSSALLVNLEDCIGCGISSWGWQDNASWTGQVARVRFATTGTHTLRVQLREDGVDVDQIVLSPVTWLNSAPGLTVNDTTIVPKPSTAASTLTFVRQPYLQQVSATAAIVVWATRQPGPAEVRYQPAGMPEHTAPATSRLIPSSVTGMGFDQYQHEAVITGLAPLTTYTYRVFAGGVGSETIDLLRTAPSDADGSPEVRFVAFGDSGVGSSAQRHLANLMTADTFDFALHTGDVVYGVEAGVGAGGYQQLHDWFFDVYRNWLRARPMFPSIGNHDDEANHAAPYRDLFVLPDNGGGAYPDHRERYYSFDYGPAHVVVLDTELAFQDVVRRQHQLAWLVDDLQRTTRPWKIAVFHRSPFSAGGEHGSDLAVRGEFAPIFEAYGVQLVLSGHEHDYERTIPWRETPGGQPVTYVVTGGGGAPLYPAAYGPWTAAAHSAHHYVRGTISRCMLSLEAVGLDGGVFDATTLQRCSTPEAPSGPVPFGGTAVQVPGVVEAEDFDEGGEGLAYHDNESGNSGGEYRTADHVDIQTTADAGGGFNVGWMSAGEWLAYSIDVTAGGIYTVQVRVAAAGPGGVFHVEVDGVDVTGPMTVPNTGGWQNWQTISRSGVHLEPGLRLMRVVVDAQGWTGIFGNINHLALTTGAAIATTPFGGVPATVPGIVEAENFDEGGQGMAYLDHDAGNNGGAYRVNDHVDIEATTDAGGGFNVGWMSAGEWLAYSIDVASAGSYTVRARVAAHGAGGTFHIEVDGADVTGPFTVPDTGGWQGWQTLERSGVTLPAGRVTLRIVVDTVNPATGIFGNINHLQLH